jgi:potassium-transporting ATPase KdpC subunit
MKTFVIALRVSLVTLVLTGLLYPICVTGLAQILFPVAANGSLARSEDGKVVGSRLLGQAFANPAYFHPRPSPVGYDPMASGGSNLGPSSAKLRARITAEIARLREDNAHARGTIPVELVTASASGLDPHIGPAAARWQIPRVAGARGVSPDRVAATLEELMAGRDLGILGEPTVNVLDLNLALDRQFGRPRLARDGRATQASLAHGHARQEAARE